VERHHLMRVPNYWRMFFRYEEDQEVIEIDQRMEAAVEELHNSRDSVVLQALNELPILVPDAHTRPFRSANKNVVAGIVLPLGLFFYLRVWRYRVRLRHDMAVIRKQTQIIIDRIDNKILNEI
jgi:lipopolysaccharide export system permease protein